jgi:subtilase family serine protease
MKTIKWLQTSVTLAVAALLAPTTNAEPSSHDQFASEGQARTAVHVNPKSIQAGVTTQPSASWFTPAQIRSAYGFDLLPSSITGAGQTIAIIDMYGDLYTSTNYTTNHGRVTMTIKTNDATLPDWTNFCDYFSLPTSGLTVVYPQGQGSVPPDTSTGNWAVEVALDTQWAHAIAPGANILLVVATDNTWANVVAAVDYAVNARANVVSMSWGYDEWPAELYWDALFNHPGVTFVACSGDNFQGTPSGAAQWWPAASPYVLGVGGTQLTNSDGVWSETAWSLSCGGISPYETMPAFQAGWQQFPTGNMRTVPDVSYVASSAPGVATYISSWGGWNSIWGTSVGAPQWAALVALANSARASGTVQASDIALYSFAAASTTPPSITATYFNDITSGANGSAPDEAAVPGFDFVTGLGSPVAQNLVPGLAGWNTPPSFLVTVAPWSQTVASGSDVSYTVTLSPFDGYNGTINLSVAGLPSGATGSFSPPSLSGSGSGASTLTIQASSATPSGTNLLVITGTDATGSPSNSIGTFLVVEDTMTVSAISYSTSRGLRGNNLNITLTVVNNLGQTVPDASVSITLDKNGSPYSSATAETGSNGEVTFTVANAPLAIYSTVVTSVIASGLSWNGKYPANSYTN